MKTFIATIADGSTHEILADHFVAEEGDVSFRVLDGPNWVIGAYFRHVVSVTIKMPPQSSRDGAHPEMKEKGFAEWSQRALGCPFCGTANQDGEFHVFLARAGEGDLVYRVVCWDCGSDGPPKMTPHEAVEAWNKRVVP